MINYKNLYSIWQNCYDNWFGRIGGVNCEFFNQDKIAAQTWLNKVNNNLTPNSPNFENSIESKLTKINTGEIYMHGEFMPVAY